MREETEAWSNLFKVTQLVSSALQPRQTCRPKFSPLEASPYPMWLQLFDNFIFNKIKMKALSHLEKNVNIKKL